MWILLRRKNLSSENYRSRILLTQAVNFQLAISRHCLPVCAGGYARNSHPKPAQQNLSSMWKRISRVNLCGKIGCVVAILDFIFIRDSFRSSVHWVEHGIRTKVNWRVNTPNYAFHGRCPKTWTERKERKKNNYAHINRFSNEARDRADNVDASDEKRKKRNNPEWK